ncbi:MAG: Gfo/Idh/MocA family oxidoreductase [Planctomycetaceae bacterium]|nr:Gfo/Idh/MocA family oxidoreductase [Planctomycetaceae bacterium]
MTNEQPMSRRNMLGAGVAGTLAIGSLTSRVLQAAPGKQPASERIQVGCIGAAGRAGSLIKSFCNSSQADLVAIADLDESRLAQGVKSAEDIQGHRPRAESDFRKLIDDPKLDVIVVGTPDHWHAIPTILACINGKDVYVEKPDGHNIVEGQRMVEAMRKHKRIVQMGSQHRSTERMKSALEFIGTGALGRVLTAKAWESAKQGNIGHPPDSEPPHGVDYDMWLGPAPKRPFNRNRFHGRWRWFHDYGTGDLGNDGVHRLDMALAMLNKALEAKGEPSVELPNRVSGTGGKWYFDDMQEFPDTMQVDYRFAGRPPRLLTYVMRIWAPYAEHGLSEGAAIYGDEGYVIMGNSGWQAFGPKDKLLAQGEGDSHEAPHVENFLNCVKSRQKPNCDLETIGHRASLLCHIGNIATRIGETLHFDAQTEEFIGDREANDYRTRPEYRKPWVLPEV